MNFDRKAVSRERVIGISFVDILIQAVFLLLVALSVGFTDPLNLLRIKEFEQVGKDLCNKVNKDDPKECQQVIEPVIEREIGKGKLALCLRVDGETRATASARFVVISPNKARFIEFSPRYLDYLKNKGDVDKLNKAVSIPKGSELGIDEIEPSFGFIREPKCFHTISHRNWEGSWNQRELDVIFSKFTSLQSFSK
jgi:hypothetical protein